MTKMTTEFANFRRDTNYN